MLIKAFFTRLNKHILYFHKWQHMMQISMPTYTVKDLQHDVTERGCLSTILNTSLVVQMLITTLKIVARLVVVMSLVIVESLFIVESLVIVEILVIVKSLVVVLVRLVVVESLVQDLP